MAHADSLRININIEDMHRLIVIILYVSNSFQNTNFPINERVCVSPQPYYLDCFEISYPNVTFNRDGGKYCFQSMNLIKGTKLAGQKWNELIDAVITILKYKKSTIYHTIYIKVFSDGKVSYLKVSTDDILNTTNNETEFPKLTRFFEEYFEIKSQEGSVSKYLNFHIFQTPIVFSVDQTDDIIELVNELFPTGKFIKVDSNLRTEFTY